jgi:hypothetical protein
MGSYARAAIWELMPYRANYDCQFKLSYWAGKGVSRRQEQNVRGLGQQRDLAVFQLAYLAGSAPSRSSI